MDYTHKKWSYRNSNKSAKSSAQSTGKTLIKFAAERFFFINVAVLELIRWFHSIKTLKFLQLGNNNSDKSIKMAISNTILAKNLL